MRSDELPRQPVTAETGSLARGRLLVGEEMACHRGSLTWMRLFDRLPGSSAPAPRQTATSTALV
jgi:hypothetical protein